MSVQGRAGTGDRPGAAVRPRAAVRPVAIAALAAAVIAFSHNDNGQTVALSTWSNWQPTRGGGDPIQLTPLEFRILYLLAMNEGQIIPYARMVDYAWGFEGGDAGLLKTHVCHVRQKLGLPANGPGAIRSLATVGYGLVKQRDRAGVRLAVDPGVSAQARDEELIAV